jgi:hypothetical protein
MTSDYRFRYVAFGLVMLSPVAHARPVRYVWSHVPKALYYQGTLTHGQETSTFRTRSTWILIPEGSTVEVKPYSRKGRVMRRAVITPRIEVLHEEVPQSVVPAKAVPAPATLVEPPKVENQADLEESTGLKLSSYMGLRLGLGRDQLTSSGGLYGYSGQSNIAPLTIGGLWVVPQSQDWGINADLSYHSFVVSNEVESISGGDKGQQKNRFTRIHAGLGGTIRAVGTADSEWPQALDLSLGLSYVQLPILKVKDPSSGQSSLVNATSIRIGLQGNYEFAITPQMSLGLSVRYAPFALDSAHPSSGYGLHLYGGYTISPGQVLDIGVQASSDDISSKSSCDTGVECSTKATSTSRVTDFRLGYKVGF